MNVTAGLTIRPMRQEDINDVLTLERLCFPTVWHPGAYLAELNNPTSLYLVAHEGDRLVGFIGASVIGEEVHILTIAVHPERRRHGYGERLLLALLGRAYERGARHATLEVREGNQAARGLYSKYGFTPIAIIGKYYVDTGEDAVVMWLNPLPRAPRPVPRPQEEGSA